MNPTELHALFTAKEQTLLVATEPPRLALMSEDELDGLLTLTRRARNKYSKLYRRQSSALVATTSSRSGTATSNQRTRRKAEIFEDALARVARALSKAARASANELKAERLEAARAARSEVTASSGRSRPPSDGPRPSAADRQVTGPTASPSVRASSLAQGARRQARRDSR